jgi:hypothetical protein
VSEFQLISSQRHLRSSGNPYLTAGNAVPDIQRGQAIREDDEWDAEDEESKENENKLPRFLYTPMIFTDPIGFRTKDGVSLAVIQVRTCVFVPFPLPY